MVAIKATITSCTSLKLISKHMRIFLGGHLNFYHPKKEKWLMVELEDSRPLAGILDEAGIPLAEVQLVAVNGEVLALENAVVVDGDQVKVFSAVGGG